MKSHQIDTLAFTVLRDLEQINETQESGLARQCGSDIQETDRLNRVHFDLAFFHTVTVAHYKAGAHPYSDTAGDFSSTDAIAKPFRKRHEFTLDRQLPLSAGKSSQALAPGPLTTLPSHTQGPVNNRSQIRRSAFDEVMPPHPPRQCLIPRNVHADSMPWDARHHANHSERAIQFRMSWTEETNLDNAHGAAWTLQPLSSDQHGPAAAYHR